MFSKDNLAGNAPFAAWAAGLNPAARISFQPNVVAPKDASVHRLWFSAASGFLSSLLAALVLTSYWNVARAADGEHTVLLAATVAAWTVALGSFHTDVLLGLARGSQVRSTAMPHARALCCC